MTSRAVVLAAGLLAACASPDDDVNRPPVAIAGKDQRVVLREAVVHVALDGESSHDPDGDSVRWWWTVVRAPTPLAMTPDDRRSSRPVVGLRGPGLYIFELTVEDERDASAPDYLNVWVVDPAWGADAGLIAPDAGPLDAGDDSGVLQDAAVVEPDAAPPPPPPDADVLPQDAAPPSPDAAPDARPPAENQAPRAVADVEPADRVAAGTPVRLSAARSRDDGGPAPLSWRWTQTGAPFGERAVFSAEGVAVEFTPRVPGRYTFELEVSDGERSGGVEVVVHATGEMAYVLDSATGQVLRLGLEGGGPLGDPVALGDVAGAVGLAARAGVLYVTTRAAQGRPARLVVAAPGRAVVRRPLPVGGDAAPPVAGRDEVWVPMLASPVVFSSDPLGAEPLASLPLPERVSGGFGLDFQGARLFLATPARPASVHLLDAASLRAVRTLFEGGERCAPRDLLVHDALVYVGCTVQNRLVRVPADFDGAPGPAHEIALPGGPEARVVKLARAGAHLVAMHARSTFVTVVPAERFDLPAGHADRAAERQIAVPLGHEAIDLAARGRRAWALVRRADGGRSLVAIDVPGARVLWAVRLAGEAAFLAVDAADDRERAFGRL